MENEKKKVVEFPQYSQQIGLSVGHNGRYTQCLGLPSEPSEEYRYPEDWDRDRFIAELQNKPIKLVRVDGFETKGYFENGLIFEKCDEYRNTHLLNGFVGYIGANVRITIYDSEVEILLSQPSKV